MPYSYNTVIVKYFQEPCSHKKNRARRQANMESPAVVEVFSGLYVNEADSPDNDEVTSEKVSTITKI